MLNLDIQFRSLVANTKKVPQDIAARIDEIVLTGKPQTGSSTEALLAQKTRKLFNCQTCKQIARADSNTTEQICQTMTKLVGHIQQNYRGVCSQPN